MSYRLAFIGKINHIDIIELLTKTTDIQVHQFMLAMKNILNFDLN